MSQHNQNFCCRYAYAHMIVSIPDYMCASAAMLPDNIRHFGSCTQEWRSLFKKEPCCILLEASWSDTIMTVIEGQLRSMLIGYTSHRHSRCMLCSYTCDTCLG